MDKQTNIKTNKRQSQKAVRRNISLPPQLDAMADSIATKFAFGNFSDYVQARLRKDAGIELVA